MSDLILNGIRLKQTCSACPEQYDAFMGGNQVGYLRLRWGNFTVECPGSYGEQVLSASPKGDGCFEEDERDTYLDMATKAIVGWVYREQNEKLHEEQTPNKLEQALKPQLDKMSRALAFAKKHNADPYGALISILSEAHNVGVLSGVENGKSALI